MMPVGKVHFCRFGPTNGKAGESMCFVKLKMHIRGQVCKTTIGSVRISMIDIPTWQCMFVEQHCLVRPNVIYPGCFELSMLLGFGCVLVAFFVFEVVLVE